MSTPMRIIRLKILHDNSNALVFVSFKGIIITVKGTRKVQCDATLSGRIM